jgi:hypothetical protein
MKTIKGLGIFTFFTLLIGCFSPPEFSNVPHIDFKDIYFKDGATVTDPDSLVLVIDFRDGDGDLGLTSDETDPPFHSTNYLIENEGDTMSLATETRYADLPPIIKVPDNAVGKLVTYRTRRKEVNGVKVYENMLPAYTYPYKCTAYRYDSIFISKENIGIYQEGDHYLDRIMKSNNANPDLYVLKDTFYYKPNPVAKNIEIEFWIRQNNANIPFIKFEPPINQNTCSTDNFFSARFPHLSETANPVEGTLKYNMTTLGLIPYFGGKTIKIKVKIRDRALNTSNTVESPEFQLESIRR